MKPAPASLVLFALLASCSADDDGTGPVVVIPNPPTNLLVTVHSSSWVGTRWTDASDNEDGFIVERCIGTGCSDFTVWRTTGPNVTGYGDINATGSTSYTYRVRARRGTDSSAYSNQASATTPAAGAIPPAPSGVVATTVSSSGISISWTDNATTDDAARVERCAGAGCSDFSVFVTILSSTTSGAGDGHLAAGTLYRYRVQLYNGAGASPYSNIAEATTRTANAAPAAPSALTAAATSSSHIALTWTNNSLEADGFMVERCLGSGCTSFAVISETSGHTYANSGLSPATTYVYRVRAYNGLGYSAYSNAVAVATPPDK
jgi:hypothetical protein